MAFGRRRETVRLPQDVDQGDSRGVPDLGSLTGDVTTYARLHTAALASGAFEERARSSWGMVARGSAALAWVADELSSGDPDRVSDAAGVLKWIGAPPDWEPWLQTLAERSEAEPADTIAAVIERISGPEPSQPAPDNEQLLLGGTRLPFTEPIWFINDTFDRVSEAAMRWLNGLQTPPRLRLIGEPLPVMLDRLEPWSMPSWKQLLVATAGSWTALFSQGSDIYTADNVGRALGCLSVRTNYQQRVVRDGRTVSYGDCALWIQDAGNELRTIQANFESKWTWHLSGEPQAFEDLDAYSATAIPDRFDLARLNAYCHALGIERSSVDFYRPQGLLIEEDTRTWVQQPTNQMSGAAWRVAHT